MLDRATALREDMAQRAEIDAKAVQDQVRAEAARDRARWEAVDAVAAKLAAEEDRGTAQQEAEDARQKQMLAEMSLAPLADMRASIPVHQVPQEERPARDGLQC